MTASILFRLGLLAVAGILLGACAETKFVMHTAKRLGETTGKPAEGNYKVGKAYQVGGVWYYPKEDWTYDRTGIASWYGPNFDGKPTANGETFDQWAVTAAHKTLPMPSLVRVTNLENGRSLVVRVNDRGPFKPGRIIDLSRRSAQLLDIEKKGTAKVRVQILGKESQALAERAKAGGTRLAQADSPIQSDGAPMSSEPVVSQSLPVPQENETAASAPSPAPVDVAAAEPAAPQSAPATVTQVPVAEETLMFVQAGAFSDPENAMRVKERLSTVGDAAITPVMVNGRELFRVRLGPIADLAEADRLLQAVHQAGYNGARTVVD